MQTVQTSSIEQCLSVGQHTIFYPDCQRPGKQRLDAVIRGWQAGAYILLEVRLEHERTLLFHEGAECSLRFLKDGVAYAIESALLTWQISRREPQMRITWPRSVRSAAIRRHERITVSIPGTVAFDDKELRGALLDLSIGGCGLAVECNATPGSQLALTCYLPDGVKIEGLPLLVRTAKLMPNGQTYLGCSYARKEHPGLTDIAFYVGTSVLRMRQHNGLSPRFLVVGRESDTIGSLRDSLDPTQCHVVTASSLLDALVHARLVVPAFILLEFDWGNATALDGCRILQASPAHKNVPIFVYGRPSDGQDKDASTLRERVLKAGAKDYYPELPDYETIKALQENHAAAAAVI